MIEILLNIFVLTVLSLIYILLSTICFDGLNKADVVASGLEDRTI